MNQAKTTLVINGKRHSVSAQSDAPVLWLLRKHLKLTGTKYGCGARLYGSCTIHVDGKAVRSCQLQLSQVKGRRITTTEGLSQNLAALLPFIKYGKVRALAVTTPKRSALRP